MQNQDKTAYSGQKPANFFITVKTLKKKTNRRDVKTVEKITYNSLNRT